MPIYDYKCKCGNKIKDVLVLNSSIMRCPQCGNEMDKDFSDMRVSTKGDIEPHYNESLGVVIKSRRHLREVLWETNSRTDDIVPSGGLTIEERAIRSGQGAGDNRSIFEKRKNPNWGDRPDGNGIVETEGVDVG